MKRKNKFFALVMAAVMSLGLMTFFSACSLNIGEKPVEKPDPAAKVYSVTLQHNDKDIDGGMLTTDLSAGKLTLTADVRKDDGADGTVTYASSELGVATIDKTGVVTLVSAGETVITASAGNKKHEVVLIVNDSGTIKATHSITVNGGTADVTMAREGDYVTISANIPVHKDFTSWQFSENVTWINGNVFKMPAGDVEITAVYEDMLYTLNVVGAKVAKADEVADPEGAQGGYTTDGESEEYAITVYQLPYETDIDVEAIEEPDGKIFVGWDYGTADNRMGEIGVPEYNFTMPDSALTVWAVFSDVNTKVYTASKVTGFTTKTISNGVISGKDSADPVFEGLSGYRITIPAGITTKAGFTNENIKGSSLDTILKGTHIVKCIFRNNGTEAVTVETGVAYYGNCAASGAITVDGGETKKIFFTAGLGIRNPYMCFAVRENNSTSDIKLDMVVGSAPMYPNGDPLLKNSGVPEYVKLTDASQNFINKPYTPYGWSRAYSVTNDVGATYVATYANKTCFTTVESDGYSYLSAPIVNMPAYDAESSKGVIYGKYINLASTIENSLTTTLKVVVCTTDNPIKSEVAAFDIESTKMGEIILFKLEFDRIEGQNYYFSLVKTKIDATGTYDANNFCIQLTYNNVMGYEEA